MPKKECKDVFVSVGLKTSCDVKEVEGLLENAKKSVGESVLEPPVVTEDDHKFPSLVWTQTEEGKLPPVAILYGDVKVGRTRELHRLLK